MKGIKFGSKKRGPKGEGRAVIYKPVQLPVDLIEELKMYKDAYGIKFATEYDEYGNIIPVHVTFEQMFRRWMDHVKKFDKDIQKEVDAYKKIRDERPAVVTYPVDLLKYDVWELEFSAWRNGYDYPLVVDPELGFYAIVDGEKKSAELLINEEYELMTDAGIEFDLATAMRISKKIIKHNKAVKQ